jgi:hypothetical protein
MSALRPIVVAQVIDVIFQKRPFDEQYMLLNRNRKRLAVYVNKTHP